MAVCNVEGSPATVESERKGFVSSGDLCLWEGKKGGQGLYLKVLVLPSGWDAVP